MKCFSSSSISLCILLFSVFRGIVSSKNVSQSDLQLASIPPRGWNSYDSFCWTISEQEFLQSAGIVSERLHDHGYEYVVVDYLWYRRKVKGAHHDSLGFDVIDEWGRMIPDPGRWPSSKDGKGFSEVANRVHSLGLKFGIHVMRGISTQAVNANTPILDTTTGAAYQESGRVWRAKDIAMPQRACAWMPHVKHDCVFGDDLDLNEISYVSEVLRKLDRPIVYSLSPGTSVTPAMAKDVSGLVNMYRITGDDWDTWWDVKAHFDVTRDFATASLIGAESLMGNSWPDLDMLPFGWLTDPGSNEGPHRNSRLNLEEKRTQMTLWSMAKSPLMYGGDVRKIDPDTYDLITNPTLLEINSFSSNNMEFPYVTSLKSEDQDYGRQMRRSSKEMKTSYTHSLGLTRCSESKASGWTSEILNQYLERICWKRSLGNKHLSAFCVLKRELYSTLDEGSMYQDDHQRKHHLVAANRIKFCLDASPKRKLTSKEAKRGTFSPCRWDSNQMWELNPNGTLANSYSGLCATVEFIEDTVNAGGFRSWIATGRSGEVYVAFFNLSEQKMVISAQTSDLAKVLPGRDFSSCKGNEVWSGSDIILHHGGKFLRDDKNVLEYVGGEIDVWEGLDVDTMCLWTPSDMCKEHGYVRFDNIWWHNPDFKLEKGLRPLAEDLDVRQMCNIGMAPNDATIDEDLRRTVDDILRMTMAPHFVEDDASEDTEVVQQIDDQSNDEDEEDSVVPRRKKRVGENVGSSSRQRRQVGSSGSDGSGGSLDGGVGENMAAGEEDAAAGEEHVVDVCSIVTRN
ncbi:Ricin B-like lectin [Sesbania bispinosa]|nr:Ricin B-like lectin [Sesbania bispinosa]